MENFRTAVNFAEDINDCISIGGGEPTIHPLFLDMLGYALIAETESVWMATNGKKTEIALRLARLAKDGKIGCTLSLDNYHDPIDEKVVKAFTRDSAISSYGNSLSHDKREIRRNIKGKIVNAGRAKKNNLGNQTYCFCDDLFVTPDGHLYPCGCTTGLKMDFGTVDKPNIHPDYRPSNCAKDMKKWKEMNG
jgi:sulfatase maturation enzyme AslB (radical SAM superfamily)